MVGCTSTDARATDVSGARPRLCAFPSGDNCGACANRAVGTRAPGAPSCAGRQTMRSLVPNTQTGSLTDHQLGTDDTLFGVANTITTLYGDAFSMSGAAH